MLLATPASTARGCSESVSWTPFINNVLPFPLTKYGCDKSPLQYSSKQVKVSGEARVNLMAGDKSEHDDKNKMEQHSDAKTPCHDDDPGTIADRFVRGSVNIR